jgi:acetolactate synthase-1/2/3 large subunit
MTMNAAMNAAQALVGTLKRHAVDRVFCVPGESFLAVLDALHDEPSIEVITCRHEGGAGFMAVADAKLTRKPGVAFVSRGPGASNASIALHVADQDAVPFVLFIGQVERKDRGRGAFQEVDYQKSFGGLCKGVWEVNHGEELAGVCAEAFALASAGVAGPVLVVLPEDMLYDAASTVADPLPRVAVGAPAAADMQRAVELLSKAERPVMIVGSALTQADVERVVKASEAWGIPMVAGWKQQHLIPNRHPHYAGHLGYNIPAAHLDILLPADLVLAVGTRLGDVTTQGYRFPLAPKPEQPLIHVHPSREALNRVHQADVAIAADCGAFLSALTAAAPKPAPVRTEWMAKTHGYAKTLMQWKGPESAPDGVVFGAVAAALNDLLPDDAILTHDAGNFSGWVHRYFYFNGRQTLIAASAGAMGIGVPAAVAAAMRYPKRRVIGFVGDGGILMTGNEIATARMYGVKPLIILSNNNSFATIRQHQEKHFPGRVKSTGLANPDFVAYAKAFGAKAWLIDSAEKIKPVLTEALAADTAAVVVVNSSLKHISAFATLKD